MLKGISIGITLKVPDIIQYLEREQGYAAVWIGTLEKSEGAFNADHIATAHKRIGVLGVAIDAIKQLHGDKAEVSYAAN